MKWAGGTGFRCTAHLQYQAGFRCTAHTHKTRGGWVEGGLVPDTLPPFTPMKCKRLPLTSKSGSSLGRLITTAKTTKLHKIFNASKVKIEDGTGVLASLGF